MSDWPKYGSNLKLRPILSSRVKAQTIDVTAPPQQQRKRGNFFRSPVEILYFLKLWPRLLFLQLWFHSFYPREIKQLCLSGYSVSCAFHVVSCNINSATWDMHMKNVFSWHLSFSVKFYHLRLSVYHKSLLFALIEN